MLKTRRLLVRYSTPSLRTGTRQHSPYGRVADIFRLSVAPLCIERDELLWPSLFYWRNTQAGQISLRRTDGTPPRSSFFSHPLFSIHFSEIFSGFCRAATRACTAISPCTPQRPGCTHTHTHTHTHTYERASLDENFRRATEAGETGTAGIFEARFVIETGRGSHKAARVHTRVLPACCCEMSLHTWAAWPLVARYSTLTGHGLYEALPLVSFIDRKFWKISNTHDGSWFKASDTFMDKISREETLNVWFFRSFCEIQILSLSLYEIRPSCQGRRFARNFHCNIIL